MSELFISADAAGLSAALLRTSWQVALLVLGILLLQKLMGPRLSPRWRYGMWLVVAVRLAAFPLAPVEVGSQANPLLWSLNEATALVAPAGPLDVLSAGPEPGSLATSSVSPIPPMLGGTKSTPSGTARGRRPADNPTGAALDTNEPSSSRAPVRATDSSATYFAANSSSPGPTVRLTQTGEQPPTQSQALPVGAAAVPSPLTRSLLIIWAAGAALALLRLIVVELRFRAKRARLPEFECPRVTQRMSEARDLVGLGKSPRMLQANFMHSPAISGILRPILLVPTNFGSELTDAALTQVLLHELYHLRRHDVLANVLFELVRTLFWFHPLVHFALSRMFAARESLRDWEALSASKFAPARGYAETLISIAQATPKIRPTLVSALYLPLLQPQPELQRRIRMITSYNDRTHRSWALGSLLCLAVSWLAFTGPITATPAVTIPESTEQAPVGETAPELLSIKFTRADAESEWHQNLRLKMEQKLQVNFDDADGFKCLDEFSAALGLDLVFISERESVAGKRVSFSVEDSAAKVLDELLRRFDEELTWTLAHRTLLVGNRYDLPESVGLRMYNIEPLVGASFDEDDLVTFLYEQTGMSWKGWMSDNVSMEVVENVLMVRVDYRTHEDLHAVLNRLLNFDPLREQPLEQGIFQKMDGVMLKADYEDAALSDVLQHLAEASDIPVECSDEVLAGEHRINLQLQEASLYDILSIVAMQCDVSLWEGKRSAFIGDHGPTNLVLRFYDIEELGALIGDHETAFEVLNEAIHYSIAQELWDTEEYANVRMLSNLMVVNATPSAHGQIKTLVQAMTDVRK